MAFCSLLDLILQGSAVADNCQFLQETNSVEAAILWYLFLLLVVQRRWTP